MRALLRVARLAPAGRGRLALAGALGVVAAGSTVGLLAASAWLISRAAQQPPVLYLMVAIVSVRAFAVARATGRYAERLVGHDAAFRKLADLRVAVYERLERVAPAGLAPLRSGDLLARLVGDVDLLQDLWLRLLLPYSVAALVGAGSVALVGVMLPGAGAVLAATLLVVAVGAPWLASRVARRAEAAVAPARGELSTATLDLLRGAPELVVYGAADRQLAAVARADAALTRAEGSSAAGAGVGALVATLAAGSAVWAGLALGVPAVRSGALDGVLLAVVVLTPLAVHEVFAGLAAAAQQAPRVRSAAERVLGVLDAAPPVEEPARPVPLPVPAPASSYGLRLVDVTAGWPGGPDVLHGLRLDIGAGERVALVGPSGAGKSTVAALVLKFLPARSGSVQIVGAAGGVDLAHLDGDDLRRVVGLCAQDAHLFDTTVGENVRLARPSAGDDELRAALRRARLLDWVDRLPDGLDTHVGEHGAKVSAGQRQRIALARTFLADFPVLVLDEPTEHLDEPTAAALMADVLAETAGRTVLLVTHRRADLGGFDRVVRLDDGVIVAGSQPVEPTPA